VEIVIFNKKSSEMHLKGQCAALLRSLSFPAPDGITNYLLLIQFNARRKSKVPFGASAVFCTGGIIFQINRLGCGNFSSSRLKFIQNGTP